MQIAIGMLIMAFFFCTHYTAFKMGHRQRKVEQVEKLSEEEKQAEEKRLKGLENIMNYDYDVAIGRRAK